MTGISDAMGTRGFWTSQPDAMGSKGFWSFVAQLALHESGDALIRRIYALVQDLGKTISFYKDQKPYTIKITPPYPCHDRLDMRTLIKYGNCLGYLPNHNLEFLPEAADKIILDDTIWLVEGIQNVIVNGEVGLYGLICEKAGNTTITPSSLWTRLDRRVIPATKKVVDKFGVTLGFDDAGTPYSHRCVIVTRTSDGFYRNELYRRGDIRALLPSEDLAFQPKYGMEVTHDSKKWIVERETPFYSGEQVALYELQLRR
jgi:hypothetical protein